MLQEIENLIDTVGTVQTLIDIIFAIGTILFVIACIVGVVKPAYRFGMGISFKKTYIVSDNEATFHTIEDDLVSSGLIKKNNIVRLTSSSIDKLAGARLIILDFASLGQEIIIQAINKKTPNCGALVYARPGEVPNAVMEKLNNCHHVSVVNFRGRLINETLMLMLSTSFSKKEIEQQF